MPGKDFFRQIPVEDGLRPGQVRSKRTGNIIDARRLVKEGEVVNISDLEARLRRVYPEETRAMEDVDSQGNKTDRVGLAVVWGGVLDLIGNVWPDFGRGGIVPKPDSSGKGWLVARNAEKFRIMHDEAGVVVGILGSMKDARRLLREEYKDVYSKFGKTRWEVKRQLDVEFEHMGGARGQELHRAMWLYCGGDGWEYQRLGEVWRIYEGSDRMREEERREFKNERGWGFLRKIFSQKSGLRLSESVNEMLRKQCKTQDEVDKEIREYWKKQRES